MKKVEDLAADSPGQMARNVVKNRPLPSLGTLRLVSDADSNQDEITEETTMDRRRFVPSSEGLDARLLLSTAAATATSTATKQALLDKTFQIGRLENVLDTLAPGRAVPTSLVSPLQDDLRAVVGRLSPPNTLVLGNFNKQLRSTLAHASITVQDAAGLNTTFGNALTAADVPLATVQKFQGDMQNLLQADSQSTSPAILAANDYSTVLEVTLAVGKPIKTPTAPLLQTADSVGGLGGHNTYLTQPNLVGHYDAGTTINVLNESGQVIGTTTSPSTGEYTVAITQPLSVGTHILRVQAIDVNGDHSLPSLGYKLIVKAKPVPKGPLG